MRVSWRHLPRERCIGFRVRIAPLSDRLRRAFRVGVGRERCAVQPVDLSLTGVLVAAPALQVRHGQTVPVELSLEELSCALTATVVRIDGPLVALHFLESLRNGELSPPEPLLALYRRLETAWLRSRVD